jgi:hypothetical protein
MHMPVGLFVFFSALVVWFVLLAVGFKRRSFGPFGWITLACRPVKERQHSPPARTTPAASGGDTYLIHPAWGTAFHARFSNGAELRSNLLYAHLSFNSIVFVLMHVQLWRPGTGNNAAWHRIIGRVSFLCLTLGTASAVWLAGSHGSVSEYGGYLSMVGFWSMSLCVYACAVMGVLAIRRGDKLMHRIWMFRFAGSMWGAFWLFRVSRNLLDKRPGPRSVAAEMQGQAP